MDMTLWHNPRCSKSRQALALLEDGGHAPRVRLYLATPPTEAEITDVIDRLKITPRDLIRRGEKLYRDLGLNEADDAALIIAMATHPILIERPVLLNGDKAVIGRPPEAVLTLV